MSNQGKSYFRHPEIRSSATLNLETNICHDRYSEERR